MKAAKHSMRGKDCRGELQREMVTGFSWELEPSGMFKALPQSSLLRHNKEKVYNKTAS